MANAVEVDIAEAIKDELNGHDFGIAFCAERSEADVSVPLTTLGLLRVDVVPWLPQQELETRGDVEYTVDVDVLIRKRFEPSEQQITNGRITTEDTDRLRQLRQDIGEFFLPSSPTQGSRRLSNFTVASLREVKVMAGLVRGHLKQHHQFTGWLRLTFVVDRVAGEA